MSFAETSDIMWPFEPHLLRNYQERLPGITCGGDTLFRIKCKSLFFYIRWCGDQCSGVWACSSALAFLS